jgi:hypothetical protein
MFTGAACTSSRQGESEVLGDGTVPGAMGGYWSWAREEYGFEGKAKD